MVAVRKRLVVGVCEHPHSTAALRYAADRALTSLEEIVAVHVQRTHVPFIPPFDVTAVLRRWAEEHEDIAFSSTVAALRGQAPAWRYLARRGDPARCLAAAAVETGATAIVLGHDVEWRFGGLRRTVARALRRAPVPVVVVGADARPVLTRGPVRSTTGGAPAAVPTQPEQWQRGGEPR